MAEFICDSNVVKQVVKKKEALKVLLVNCKYIYFNSCANIFSTLAELFSLKVHWNSCRMCTAVPSGLLFPSAAFTLRCRR